MTEELFDALLAYIDARVEYEIACHVDSGFHGEESSTPIERLKEAKASLKRLVTSQSASL